MSEFRENAKKIFLSDFEYFRLWYDFYFNIEKYLPATDLDRFFEMHQRKIFEILISSRCSRTSARKNLLNAFGLSEIVDYDIGDEKIRLITKGKDSIQRAIKVAGAIFHHKDIIKIISKKELENVMEFIGQKTYYMILKRGMMLWKLIPELESSKEPKTSIIEKIKASGKAIFGLASCGLPAEVKKRLTLMFEESFEIPEKCDPIVSKRSFELIKFSMANS